MFDLCFLVKIYQQLFAPQWSMQPSK
jgi:hypothetical protein